MKGDKCNPKRKGHPLLAKELGTKSFLEKERRKIQFRGERREALRARSARDRDLGVSYEPSFLIRVSMIVYFEKMETLTKGAMQGS